MRGNETETFVKLVSAVLVSRGVWPLTEDEQVAFGDAFDDAVNAKVEAFWNEQHRTRD